MKLRAQLNSFQARTVLLTHRIDFAKTPEGNMTIEQVETNINSPLTDLIVSANTINITNKNNELIRLDAFNVNRKDVAIENLQQCEIFLKGVPSSLQIKNLHTCVLIVGPCSRSILIDQCKQCEFALACQQLRIHNSNECDFYVHITAQPIIEDSYDLRFAPYNIKYKFVVINTIIMLY